MPIHIGPVSRRKFIEGVVALSPALALGHHALADESTDSHMWAMITDTHIAPLNAFRSKDKPVQDRATRLVPHLGSVCQDILSMRPRTAGLIHNGDCVEFGTAEDYELFLSSVAGLAKSGIPLHLTLGNHDHRPNFVAQVPKGLGLGVDSEVSDRFVSVVRAERANWFLLDSLIMEDSNRGGMLGGTQLEWLAKALDKHSDRPAIVVAHHNVNYQEKPGSRVETIVQSAAPHYQSRRRIAGHEGIPGRSPGPASCQSMFLWPQTSIPCCTIPRGLLRLPACGRLSIPPG